MRTEDIIQGIKVDDEAVVSRMLHDLVNEHRNGRGNQIRNFERRYEQRGLPIQTRVTRNPNKIDERIPNDFFSDIIDTKQGYMGNEVTVDLPEGTTAQLEALKRFHRLNDAVDQNSEMVKAAARDGVGYRLLYIPEGLNEIRTKQLPASETVTYEDESLGTTVYAMRYWYVDDVVFQGARDYKTKRTVVEWYDKENITYYIDDGQGNYKIDRNKGREVETEEGRSKTGVQPHLFNGVPIIKFRNNEEGQGEAEKVLSLIDAYDTIVSATVSEIEQFRLAYLALKDAGGTVTDDFMRRLEQTGVFPLGPNGDAKFITKDAAVESVKIVLDELRINIYQFARSIDLSKDYGGDLRVIGWQVALLNLENSCKVTERKFKQSLLDEYQLISQKWAEWGVQIDPLDLEFTFTRNFPKDLGSEAKILLDLLGTVSRKTAYSLMSFIGDPEAEAEAYDEERTANADMFGLGLMNESEDDTASGDQDGD